MNNIRIIIKHGSWPDHAPSSQKAVETTIKFKEETALFMFVYSQKIINFKRFLRAFLK